MDARHRLRKLMLSLDWNKEEHRRLDWKIHLLEGRKKDLSRETASIQEDIEEQRNAIAQMQNVEDAEGGP